jgi:hypothetical protein
MTTGAVFTGAGRRPSLSLIRCCWVTGVITLQNSLWGWAEFRRVYDENLTT